MLEKEKKIEEKEVNDEKKKRKKWKGKKEKKNWKMKDKLKSAWKEEDGAITVFSALMFLVLLVFFFALIEGIYINTAKSRMKRSLERNNIKKKKIVL